MFRRERLSIKFVIDPEKEGQYDCEYAAGGNAT
jgi:hypothetical protein